MTDATIEPLIDALNAQRERYLGDLDELRADIRQLQSRRQSLTQLRSRQQVERVTQQVPVDQLEAQLTIHHLSQVLLLRFARIVDIMNRACSADNVKRVSEQPAYREFMQFVRDTVQPAVEECRTSDTLEKCVERLTALYNEMTTATRALYTDIEDVCGQQSWRRMLSGTYVEKLTPLEFELAFQRALNATEKQPQTVWVLASADTLPAGAFYTDAGYTVQSVKPLKQDTFMVQTELSPRAQRQSSASESCLSTYTSFAAPTIAKTMVFLAKMVIQSALRLASIGWGNVKHWGQTIYAKFGLLATIAYAVSVSGLFTMLVWLGPTLAQWFLATLRLVHMFCNVAQSNVVLTGSVIYTLYQWSLARQRDIEPRQSNDEQMAAARTTVAAMLERVAAVVGKLSFLCRFAGPILAKFNDLMRLSEPPTAPMFGPQEACLQPSFDTVESQTTSFEYSAGRELQSLPDDAAYWRELESQASGWNIGPQIQRFVDNLTTVGDGWLTCPVDKRSLMLPHCSAVHGQIRYQLREQGVLPPGFGSEPYSFWEWLRGNNDSFDVAAVTPLAIAAT